MSSLITPVTQFIPVTVKEYIALQFAKGLSDEVAVRRYVYYLTHYKADYLLHLFHRSKQELDPAHSFHSSLNTSEP